MIRGFVFQCFAWVSVFILCHSCYVENAPTSPDRQLVIASDYLTEKDTVLFTKFAKRHNIHLIVRPIRTNEIIGLIRNADHNSGLDVLMIKSLNSVLRLHKQHILHPIHKNDPTFALDTSFISEKYDYIGLGFDPFIIRYNGDSIPTPTDYEHLSATDHYNLLSEEDLLCFLSPLRKALPRAQANSWIRNWKNHASDEKDTSFQAMPVYEALDVYSSLQTPPSDSVFNSLDAVSFPTGKGNGAAYNLRTICIINQAEHYRLANDFIRFYRNPGYNDELNEQLGTLGLHYELTSTKTVKLSTYQPEALLQYQSMIQRVINKLDK